MLSPQGANIQPKTEQVDTGASNESKRKAYQSHRANA